MGQNGSRNYVIPNELQAENVAYELECIDRMDLKRQLDQRGVGFESLDNGLLSCEDPRRAQHLADGFSEHKIERFFRKWLARLPHPFPASDRKAGYRYQLSIWQLECALTQGWDR